MPVAEPELASFIKTPSPVSCIDAAKGIVLVGCEDGSVRRYCLPETRVQKALMGAGAGVSSIKLAFLAGDETHAWLASGMDIYRYDFSVSQEDSSLQGSIMKGKDALVKISVSPEGDDEINEVALKKDCLVFTTDSGRIGVLDTSSGAVSFCRQTHRNIALPIAFLNSRPAEICSGGYDNTVLHFDARAGSLLSHLDIGVPSFDDPTAGISLPPPFVLSMAISSDDLIACGIATGHVWVGYGGSRKASSSQGKRKSRKWNGLRSSESHWLKAGNGPIISVAFDPDDESRLLTMSLHGNVSCFKIPVESEEGVETTSLWNVTPKFIAKGASLAITGDALLVGGITSSGKGMVESWKLHGSNSS